MYLPPHFKMDELGAIHAAMRASRLATLVTTTADGLIGTPLPLMLAEGEGEYGTLYGHVARPNPQWKLPVIGEAMAVFTGPDAYVTPSWYVTKAEHGKVVPTWNYVTVQARGPLRAIDDAAWVHAFVTRLTTRHEAAQAKPWAVTDAPPEFIETMTRAIVGIEITLTALTGKWKVSQNRGTADRAGVVGGLQAAGLIEAARSIEG